MKKLFGFMVLAVLLTGCSEPTVSEVPQDTGKRFNGVNQSINIITDSETNCKYIYIDSGVADQRVVSITPLMKNFDQVDCGQ